MPEAPVVPLLADLPGTSTGAPCGFLVTTPEGLVLEVNDLLIELVDRPADELVGHAVFVDLLTAGGRIFHETQVAAMLASVGEAQELALDLARPDGSTVPVLVNAVVDHDGHGTPYQVRFAVFRASDRRHYERDLLDARRSAQSSERRARALTRTLQQILVPPAPPVVPGLEVGAAYRPAGRGDEVGGDFYDVFQLGPARWVAVVGDVCGKGVEAAVVTALARHTLRAAAVGMTRPSEALRTLNDVLLRDGSERHCTVGLLLLEQDDREDWTATISLGGHPLPILARRDGSVAMVGEPGSLLGVFGSVDLVDTAVPLGAGDALLLYTDGIVEARGAGEFYGDERLLATVARLPHAGPRLVDAMMAESLTFSDGDPRDDIAMVAVSRPLFMP